MWEYLKSFFITPVHTTTVHERNIKNEMQWLGYAEEQIATMTQDDYAFFEKYSLNPNEKLVLTQKGVAEKQLMAINHQMLILGRMNEYPDDEGCGISPMSRNRIMNLALSKLKPVEKFNEPSGNFQKVFKEPTAIPQETLPSIELINNMQNHI